MTPEEFRRYGHMVVDRIADYRATAHEMPVMSSVRPGAIRTQLPAIPPVDPESFESILADVDRVIVPGLSHWQHPAFFGYFPSNGELAAVLGDFLSTGFGVLGLSWQSSPALTELEEVSTDWLRQMMGLAPAWQGVIQDTASTSTLVALVSARERTTGMSAERGGMQDEDRAVHRIHVGPGPQFRREGRAARRVRARTRACRPARPDPCDGCRTAGTDDGR